MKVARTCGGSPAELVVAWLVSEATSRFSSSAPTDAVPITVPTWRTVLSTPDAAPAICGLTLRMAVVVIGANVRPCRCPATISGGRKSCHGSWVRPPAPPSPCRPANRVRPLIRMYLPPILSVSRPGRAR